MSDPVIDQSDLENDLNDTRIRIIGARAVWATWAWQQAQEAHAYGGIDASEAEWRGLHVIDDALRKAETELENALRLLDQIAGQDKPRPGTGVPG